MPDQQTQSPPEREWPEDFSNWVLGLAIFFSGVLAVILPIYSPSLWTDHNLPSYVPFLVGAAGSVAALGHGVWVGVVLWQRRFPRTHWRKVRRRLTTATWASVTVGAVLLEAWPWVVLFAVLLALQLTRRSQLVVWERLGHATTLLAYQGALTVNVNVRTALELPMVRKHYLESYPECDDGHFEAWVDARCSELPSGTHEQVRWTFDNLCVYKNGERQFVRAVYHEITLGPKTPILANSWDDVALRLCLLNGWLKLQVGRGEVKHWRDIAAFPIYLWVFTHRLPGIYMSFDANLEHSFRSRLDKWRAASRQINQRATDYLRYLEETASWHEPATFSWFRNYLDESWMKERGEWARTSGATFDWKFDYLHVYFQNLMDCSVPRGGSDHRDVEFEKVVLPVYRDDNYL